MKIFIVFAHPEPTSFNGAMFQLTQKTLIAAGHELMVSDLYGMGFNPVPGPHDVIAQEQAGSFLIQVEQEAAARNNGYAPDIAAEQNKLYWCDLVIFQFPLWWFGIPAIMKGWFDRVLAYGWAYSRNERFDSGRLSGRKALLSVTTGSAEERFAEDSLFAPMDQLLYPITVGTLQYVGLRTLEPFIAWSVSRVDDEERLTYLDRLCGRLSDIEHEESEPFHSLKLFPDPTGGTLMEPTDVLQQIMANRENK